MFDGVFVTTDPVEELSGSVGHFWPQSDSLTRSVDDSPTSGTIRRLDDGSLQLVLLVATKSYEHHEMDRLSRAEMLIGLTDAGTVLIDDARAAGTNLKGTGIGAIRFTIKNMIKGVSMEPSATNQVDEVSGEWHGISRWAGITPSSEHVSEDSSGRVTGYEIKLQQSDTVAIDLTSAAARLELGSAWSVSGPVDSRTVSSPLTISIRPTDPQRVDFSVSLLGRVLDLLSVAFQGFAAASGGGVRMHHEKESRPRSCDLWADRLMLCPRGVRPVDSNSKDPIFYLEDIGGLPGVDRWIRLHGDVPQIVRPVVTPFQRGYGYAESILVDIGTGIDYWRGSKAKSRSWAREKFQPLAVANSLGVHFANWLGGAVQQWADLYWYHYRGLKHYIPDYEYDPEAINYLAYTGRVLLTCVVLQEISEPSSSAAVERALNNYHWAGRGTHVEQWLRRVRHPKCNSS